MRRIVLYLLCFMVLSSCTKDSDDVVETLAGYLENSIVDKGAVIACSASDENSGAILTFFYPEEGASNIRFYETKTDNIDSSIFSNYTRVYLNSEPFFNGYLRKFTQASVNEKWIIVTLELDGEIKISNPIRTKQVSKPTFWHEEVSVNQSQLGMPSFMWEDNLVGDNAIYFQVISDENSNLLSGTYTYENQFQYYNTSNVILNITTQTPPSLVISKNYNFTLMDVSLDNWVNSVIQKSFTVE